MLLIIAWSLILFDITGEIEMVESEKSSRVGSRGLVLERTMKLSNEGGITIREDFIEIFGALYGG